MNSKFSILFFVAAIGLSAFANDHTLRHRNEADKTKESCYTECVNRKIVVHDNCKGGRVCSLAGLKGEACESEGGEEQGVCR